VRQAARHKGTKALGKIKGLRFKLKGLHFIPRTIQHQSDSHTCTALVNLVNTKCSEYTGGPRAPSHRRSSPALRVLSTPVFYRASRIMDAAEKEEIGTEIGTEGV
jgi:hypothetical protein